MKTKVFAVITFLFLPIISGCDLFAPIGFSETYYKVTTPEKVNIVQERMILRGVIDVVPNDGVVSLLFERLQYTEKGLLQDVNRVIAADNALVTQAIPEKSYKIGSTYEASARFDQVAWSQDCKAIVPDHIFCTTRNRPWDYFPMAMFSLTEVKEVP